MGQAYFGNAANSIDKFMPSHWSREPFTQHRKKVDEPHFCHVFAEDRFNQRVDHGVVCLFVVEARKWDSRMVAL